MAIMWIKKAVLAALKEMVLPELTSIGKKR